MSKEIPKINNPLDFISDSELHSDKNGMLSLDVGDASVSLYVAWVPCLAGQIFYSLSEPGLADFDSINVNQLDHDPVTHAPKCRYILSSSVVDWKDSGNKDESGLARVIVLAKATSLQKLSGDVFVIPFHKDDSDYDKKKQHAILTEDLYQISKRANLTGGTSDNVGNRVCTKEFKDLFDTSDQNEGSLISKLKLLDGWFVHQVSFEMDDAGFTYLYCSGLKPKNEKSFNLDADIVKSIASPIHTITRQSFYYLKYLFHKHSHHEHGTDSVTTIHRCRADPSIIAHALLGDLKKGLVDEKRANKSSLYEAEGIATYGRSLAISCQRKGFFEENGSQASKALCPEEQQRYFSNLSDSIHVLRQTHTPIKKKIRDWLTISQQILVILFLFVTPSLLIMSSVVKNGNICEGMKYEDFISIDNYIKALLCGEVGIGPLFFIYVVLLVLALGSAVLIERKKVFSQFSSNLINYMQKRAFSRFRGDWSRYGMYWYVIEKKSNLKQLENRLRNKHENFKIYLLSVMAILLGVPVISALLIYGFHSFASMKF